MATRINNRINTALSILQDALSGATAEGQKQALLNAKVVLCHAGNSFDIAPQAVDQGVYNTLFDLVKQVEQFISYERAELVAAFVLDFQNR